MLLQPRQRDHRIVAGDTRDGRQQGREAALGDQRCDLAAEASGARRLVHDHATAGLGNRGEDRLFVVRFEGGEVDHLGADAVGSERVGGSQSLLQDRAPADQRHVLTLPQDERDVERQGLAVVLDLLLGGAIEPRRLEKHDGIWIANGRQQQPVGALRRGRDDDAQAGNVGEHGFRVLRMMLGRAYAGATGSAQHHRAAEPSLRAIAQSRGVIHELIDAGVAEAHELDLAHRLQALQPPCRRIGR